MAEQKIYKAINAIMAECPAIAKNHRSAKQNFMYRGIDVVMNVFQPLLSKHGVFAVPEVLEHRREERQSANGGNLIYSVLKMKYTFYADDGSNVSVTVIGEGMDSGDKARSGDGVVRCEACREKAKQIPSRIEAGDSNGNVAYND